MEKKGDPMRAVRLRQQDARRLQLTDARGHSRSPTPHAPAVVPAVLCAVDPGVMHCGYAVLRADETLVASGTWIPKSTLSSLDRHLWLLSRLQDLLALYQPGVLAFEDYVWRLTEGEGHPLRGRSHMERLIGGLETLALYPPFPVLMPLLPQVWGKQLYGDKSHSKQQIAWTVNQRMGTSYDGGVYSNHESDAVGIGLVALDTLKRWSHQRHGSTTPP